MSHSLAPITVDRIDPEAAKVVRRLLRHGHEAYLVGGCVRDLLLERTPKDFDVATSATPTEIRGLFRNSRIIGRRFRLVHIFFGPKIIETATFRAAPPPAQEGGDPLIWQDNEFGSAQEDARRRDFTINGLFYDVASGKVIDWVDGMADLRAGSVRTIGDPSQRMQEDPVRILRAAKFAARLGFGIEAGTREAMVEHAALLARCSVARVLEEIYKLLRGGAAAEAFRELQSIAALDVLFPELGALFEGARERAMPALRAGRRRRPRRERMEILEVDEDDLDGLEALLGKAVDEIVDLRGSAEVDDEFGEDEETPPGAAHEHDLEDVEDELEVDDDAELEADGEELEILEQDDVLRDEFDEDDDQDVRDQREHQLAERLLETLQLAPEGRSAIQEQLWAHLKALDELVGRLDTPPQPPLLLGALLSPLASVALQADRKMGATAEQVDALVRAVSVRLQVSRRHRERLKQIIVAQRRLLQGRPRPSMMQREYFSAAFQLLELRSTAQGEELDLSRWEDIMGRRKRRRRRRRKPRRAEGASERSQATAPPSESPASDS